MSYRSYVTIGDSEEKVYDHVEAHGEYLCDACGKILEPMTPQLHITVNGTQFESTVKEGRRVPQFPLDLHPDCVLLSGRRIMEGFRSVQATQLARTWDTVMDSLRGSDDDKFSVEVAKFIVALADRILKKTPGGKQVYHPLLDGAGNPVKDSRGMLVPDLDRPMFREISYDS